MTITDVRIEQSIPQLIFSGFIQVVGLTAAILFGVYSIPSWKNSEEAKAQADAANLLSLLAFCSQNENSTDFGTMWGAISPAATRSLHSVVSSMFPNPTATTTASPVATPSPGLSPVDQIQIIVPAITACVSLAVLGSNLFISFARKRRNARDGRHKPIPLENLPDTPNS